MPDAYLVLYNGLATCLSALSFVSVFLSLALRGGSPAAIWQTSGNLFLICQGLAFLETVHAVVGISRGSPVTSLMQWSGKSNVLLLMLWAIPEIQNSVVTAILFGVWAFSETIRYYYYLVTILAGGAKGVPKSLTWLRYNIFIPLYPIGMLAERAIMFEAVPWIEQRNLHSYALPNATNFAFDYALFVKCLAPIYPLVWLPMYLHMWALRAKKLGGKAKKT